MLQILDFNHLRSWLRTHQHRLRVGDELPFISNIAKRAGIHRDTIYACLNGDKVSERTQYALTRVMREIEQETASITKTRLMSISLNQGVPRLHIGLQAAPILSKQQGCRRIEG
jgi:hypothetical protein